MVQVHLGPTQRYTWKAPEISRGLFPSGRGPSRLILTVSIRSVTESISTDSSLSPAAPERRGVPDRADTVAGFLAVGAALAVAAGSFFDVARTAYPGAANNAFASMALWSQTTGDDSGGQSRLLFSGLSMTLSAVSALALGLALLWGRGRGARLLRAGAAVACGMVAATALDELLSAVDTGRLAEGSRFTFGAGFWLFSLAMLLAAAAISAVFRAASSRAPRQVSHGAMPQQTRSTNDASGSVSPLRETADPLASGSVRTD